MFRKLVRKPHGLKLHSNLSHALIVTLGFNRKWLVPRNISKAGAYRIDIFSCGLLVYYGLSIHRSRPIHLCPARYRWDSSTWISLLFSTVKTLQHRESGCHITVLGMCLDSKIADKRTASRHAPTQQGSLE